LVKTETEFEIERLNEEDVTMRNEINKKKKLLEQEIEQQ
jgi:hypothetical protein